MIYKLIFALILTAILIVGCSGSPTQPDPSDDNLTLDCRAEGLIIKYVTKISYPGQTRMARIENLLRKIVLIDLRKLPANTTDETMFPDFTIDELRKWIACEVALSMRDSCKPLIIGEDEWDEFYFYNYSLAQIIYYEENSEPPIFHKLERGGLLYAFKELYTSEQIESIAMAIAEEGQEPYDVSECHWII